jgi:hypothetical protein
LLLNWIFSWNSWTKREDKLSKKQDICPSFPKRKIHQNLQLDSLSRSYLGLFAFGRRTKELRTQGEDKQEELPEERNSLENKIKINVQNKRDICLDSAYTGCTSMFWTGFSQRRFMYRMVLSFVVLFRSTLGVFTFLETDHFTEKLTTGPIVQWKLKIRPSIQW